MNRILSRSIAVLLVASSIFAVQTQLLHGQQSQFIPSSAFAAFDCKPKEAFSQPSMEIMPRELIKVFGEQELGVDLLEITRATFLVGEIKDEEMNEPPEFGAIVRFATPQTLGKKITDDFEKTTIDGRTAYEEDEVSILLYDEKTILFGSNEFLGKMLSAEGASSPLIAMMSEAKSSDHINVYVVMEPIRAILKQNLPDRREVPPPFRNFLKIPDLVESITFRNDVSTNSVSEYIIRAVDEKSVEEIQQLIAHGFDLGKNAALSAITTQMEVPEAYQEATLAYAERLSIYLESVIQPEINGRDLVFDTNQGYGVSSTATIGVLIGMLLPAVQQVREAARRTSSMNILRQLALASLNYQSALRHLPMNANYDENGKPLLSWRVLLLPYLEQQALYEQFNLDEPWDSPNNIKLLDQMPAIYQNPNLPPSDSKTVYLALTGEGTVFPGNEKTTFAQIQDGPSNTAMFVEANESHAVEWTKPQDLDFDPNDPMQGLGTLRPAGFVCAFCDGSVRLISRGTDPEVWKSIVLIKDGQ